MKGPFVSPRTPVDFVYQGVTFRLRPLTAEQKLPLLLGAKDGERVVFGAAALNHAIRVGLIGWSGDAAPPWSEIMAENLGRLSDGAYMRIATELINMTFVGEDEKKSS